MDAAASSNNLYIYDISNPNSPSSVGNVAIGTAGHKVWVQGRYAYVVDEAGGGTLKVIDISAPASPAIVNTINIGAGTLPVDITVQGRYAYVLNYTTGTLQSYDVGGAYIQQLETGGVETGTLTANSNANIGGDLNVQGGATVGQSVQVNGNIGTNGYFLQQNTANSTTAFQIQNSSGAALLTADTTNQRISVGTGGTATGQLYVSGSLNGTALGTATLTGGPQSIAVHGNYVYTASKGANSTSNFQIIDVSNPASPVVTATSPGGAPNAEAKSVFVAGRYAYVTYDNGSSVQGMQIFDITNPSSIGVMGFVTTPGGVSSRSAALYVQGRYAYIPNGNNLSIIDVSNPSRPVIVGAVASGAGDGVFVQGHYAYVANYANATFRVFDVSNPASPTQTATIASDNNPTNVQVQGKYAYVTTAGSSKVDIFDISNPASISSVATPTVQNQEYGQYIQGHYDYVTSSVNNLITVLDITNPASPSTVSSISSTFPDGIAVQGRYLYTVSPSTNNLSIFDAGGAYVQQLQAGGAQTGSLQVDMNAAVNGDLVIGSGLTVGGNAQFDGNIGASGTFNLQSATNAAGALQVANSSGTLALGVSTSSNTVNIGGLAVPVISSLVSGSAGGSLVNGTTYYYRLTALDANGGETAASAEKNFTATANQKITANWSAISGATGYRLYRGTTPGGETGYLSVAGGGTTTYTNDGTIGLTGASVPVISTASAIHASSTALTIQPTANSTSTFQIQNAGGTAIMDADTTNSKVDVTGILNFITVADPTTAPTTAVGVAGALTGSYYYTVSYVTAAGETAYGPFSSPVVSPSSQKVNLTAVPLSPSPLVTARRIYRGTNNNNGPWQLVGTINDNTTTTFTDNNTSPTTSAKNYNATAAIKQNGNIVFLSDASGYNLFAGTNAGASNTYGGQNTFLGKSAGVLNSSGYNNTVVGSTALASNVSGASNTAVGQQALAVSTGSFNTAVGGGSLSQATGSRNTAFGSVAGNSVVGGTNNSFLGDSAGFQDSGGNFVTTAAVQGSTAIGAYAQVQANNSIVLGSVDTATNVGIGTTIPLNTFSVSPVDTSATAGTAYQSGTTITGVGTTWTSSVVGEQFIFSTGQTATITARASNTSLTASVSQSVSSNPGIAYRIHHVGFQVKSDGTAYLQQTSTTAFQVQNAAGTAILAADTTNSKVSVTGNLNLVQVAGPASAPTFGADTGGSLGAGTYYYVVSYTTAAGETNYGPESAGHTIAASKTINLTAVPVSGSALVTARNIYRGTVSGGPYALAGTIANNTTTTFADNNTTPSGNPTWANKTSVIQQNGSTIFLSDSNSYDVFVGQGSGANNSTGYQNTFVGNQSGFTNTTGYLNTGLGSQSLNANTTGTFNTALGANALATISTNGSATAVGASALSQATGGSNTAVGAAAGNNIIGGSGNTFLGYFAGYQDSGGNFVSTAALQNAGAIGAYAQVQANNSIVLGSVDTATNVGIGTTIPLNTFSVSPVDVSGGTAGTGGVSSTSVTGVGTAFAASMIGEQMIWQDGQTNTITAVGSGTSLTLNSAVTEANTQHYRIHHTGFQVKSDGTAYLQQTSATAFQLQDTTGTTLLTADTSGMVIKVSGTTGTFATLEINNAHFKSTQTTAPTIGTPTNCGGGTGPSAAVTASSTDSAGSFTITAGTTGGPTTCDTVVTFNKAYGAAPKSIIVTAQGAATASARQIYVSASGTTTFTVKFGTAPANSEANTYYYWVVE